MSGATREIEVKIAFADAAEARRRIETLEVHEDQPRTFEDNVLFDRPDAELTRHGKLLRVRRYGDRSWMTYKAKTEDSTRHLVRIEHETALGDADATERLLAGLGYAPIYRYQKYRTTFAGAGLAVCLDETPIGCFVELEGDPDRIDAAAARLGVDPDAYIVDNYRELHRAAAARGEIAADAMVFASATSS